MYCSLFILKISCQAVLRDILLLHSGLSVIVACQKAERLFHGPVKPPYFLQVFTLFS